MNARPARFLSAALAVSTALSLGCPAALAQAAEADLRAWVASMDASPDWIASFGSLSTDAAGKVTTLSGLTIRPENGRPGSLRFEPIRVANYAKQADGGFSASEVTLGGAVLEFPNFVWRVGAIRLADLSVPALSEMHFDKNRLFSSIVSAYALAAKVKLAEATMDSMTLEQTVEGTTTVATYSNQRIRRMADGKIDSWTSGPVSVVAPSPEGLLKYSIAYSEARGTDLGALVWLLDPKEYRNGVGDVRWRQAVAFASNRDIRFEMAGVRVEIAAISMEDARVRQPPKPFVPFYEALLADPPLPKAETERLAREYGLDMLWSMGVGRIGVDGLDVRGTGVDHFRLGQFYIRDMSADGIAEIAFGGIRVAKPGEADVALGRLAFGGLTFPSLATIREAMAAEDRGQGSDPTKLIPHLGFFEMVGLNFDMAGKGKGALDRARLDLGAYVSAIPTAIDFALKGLRLDVESIAEPDVRRQLAALGYDQLIADYGFSVRWNEASERLSIRDLVVALRNAGKLTAEVELAGLRREALENPKLLDKAIQSLLFVGARLTVEDNSLFDRLLKTQAKDSGVSEEEYRKQIAEAMPFFLMMLRNPDFQTKLAPTLKAFVLAPGRLVLKAQPLNPIPFLALLETAQKSPQRLPNVLSVEVVKE